MSASTSHSGSEMPASASHSGSEMSASASHSGSEMSTSASHSDIDSNAPKATAVKAEMKSVDKTCVTKTRVPTKAELQTALKNWSAVSSVIKLSAGESEREYKHSEPLQWKCIICRKPINTTPVFQCQTGHLACFSCSRRGISCYSCSRAVSRIRNLAVEKMINSLLVTCKFAKLGCSEEMKLAELEKSKHEDNCSFMPMFCPMPGCKHAGVKNLLTQHLLSEHSVSYLVDVGESRFIESTTFSDFVGYMADSDEFDLDSSITSVLLKHKRAQEFHLLHHQRTAMGDRIKITSLAKSRKRKYGLFVKVSEELTYCYKFVSTSNIQPDGGLLIPKQSDGDTPKKRCKVILGME